jgi:PTS system nitrogen regulatory IIA component
MKICEILGEQDIVLGMPAKGKCSALAAVAEQLGARVVGGRGAVQNAILRRERLGSTAIGNGAAVPHARLDGISDPAAMVATLQQPVAFGALDHEPVDLLLALLWPISDASGFLPVLSRCCRLLRNPELGARLRTSKTQAEAYGWIERFDGDVTRRAKVGSQRTDRLLMPYQFREARA